MNRSITEDGNKWCSKKGDRVVAGRQSCEPLMVIAVNQII
jgi:hypothetical protein